MKTNKELYRILVLDDHPIVVEGIIAIASQQEGVVCKGVTCASEAEQLICNEAFELCIVDLELPEMNGFQFIARLHEWLPDCRVLVYTMHEEPWIIGRLAALDIHGAVSKNASTADLSAAICAQKSGYRYFSHAFNELGKERQSVVPLQMPSELSKREKEVLAYLSQGLSTVEISQLLCLSSNTIHTYRKRLMEKLEAKNVAELVYKGKFFL